MEVLVFMALDPCSDFRLSDSDGIVVLNERGRWWAWFLTGDRRSVVWAIGNCACRCVNWMKVVFETQ